MSLPASGSSQPNPTGHLDSVAEGNRGALDPVVPTMNGDAAAVASLDTVMNSSASVSAEVPQSVRRGEGKNGAATETDMLHGEGIANRSQQHVLPVPRLQLESAMQDVSNQQREESQECEDEIDRLVHERLEGKYTDRVHPRQRLRDMSRYHYTWKGKLEGRARGTGWAIFEGLRDTSSMLLGRLETPAASCKRAVQTAHVYIVEGGDEDGISEVRRPTSEDDFKDFLKKAPADPIPGKIGWAVSYPNPTPPGRTTLTTTAKPTSGLFSFMASSTGDGSGSSRSRSQGADALTTEFKEAASANVTRGGAESSSRAKARVDVEDDGAAEPRSVFDTNRSSTSGVGKSTLASSIGSSSVAALLGPLAAGTAGSSKSQRGNNVEDSIDETGQAKSASSRSKSPAPRSKGESKTIVSGLNSSSNASALLGSMMQGQNKKKIR